MYNLIWGVGWDEWSPSSHRQLMLLIFLIILKNNPYVTKKKYKVEFIFWCKNICFQVHYMCRMTGITTYSKILCQFIEIVFRGVWDGGKKKNFLAGGQGPSHFTMWVYKIRFFRDCVFKGVHIYLSKNKLCHTFFLPKWPSSFNS